MTTVEPFVTVLMPVRNEGDFIERSLGAVLNQVYPVDRFEVLVVDGMSEDSTRRIVERLGAERNLPSVVLLDNPQRIVATALNIGIRQARGEILLRVDGHCEIGRDHLRKSVNLLLKDDGAIAGVGGPVDTVNRTYVGRAIAAAMASRLGVGGSAFRVGVERPRVADTVPFPAYSRSTIDRAGPYDEELVRNQDDEYNYRIRGLGGRLVLDPALESRYHSRPSLRGLWRQYFQYGFWKVRVLQKHPRQMSLRQFVPGVLVSTLLVGGAALVVHPGAVGVVAAVAGSYLIAVLMGSLWVAARKGVELLPVLPLSFLALHLGYGSGFLVGLLRFWNRWRDSSTLAGGVRWTPDQLAERQE